MRTFIFSLAVLTFLSSCSKDQDEESLSESNTSVLDYYPLAVGNYWIYDRFGVNSSGDVTYQGQDSVVVENDTLINGHVYYVQESYMIGGQTSQIKPGVVRDSLSYIVDTDGRILFSHEDTTNPLHFEEVNQSGFQYTVSAFMNLTPENITVPAGSYDCIIYVEDIDILTPIPGSDSQKFDNAYYTLGIGRVQLNRNYASSNSQILYQLNSYQFN